MAIIKLTKDNFEQEVLKSEKPVSKSERLMWTSRWNWHRNMES